MIALGFGVGSFFQSLLLVFVVGEFLAIWWITRDSGGS